MAMHLYWAGRYLERVEATARLVRTHTELFIDLPRAAGLGWEPLLAVTGSREPFDDEYDVVAEDDVVAFLLADSSHQGSVVASMAQVRENFRVSRGHIPRRLWEVVNETDLWVRSSASAGCNRGTRLMWTEEVIRRCLTVSGSETATMSRDQSYAFLQIGRLLERADMTSRVLDVAVLMMGTMGEALAPFDDLIWMSMLRSVGGEQMYRRQMGGMVAAPQAVQFLLRDTAFPRSVGYCLIDISRWLLELPHHQEAMIASVEVQHPLYSVTPGDVDVDLVHRFVDELQLGLSTLHDRLAETYFLSLELADT